MPSELIIVNIILRSLQYQYRQRSIQYQYLKRWLYIFLNQLTVTKNIKNTFNLYSNKERDEINKRNK